MEECSSIKSAFRPGKRAILNNNVVQAVSSIESMSSLNALLDACYMARLMVRLVV